MSTVTSEFDHVICCTIYSFVNEFINAIVQFLCYQCSIGLDNLIMVPVHSTKYNWRSPEVTSTFSNGALPY